MDVLRDESDATDAELPDLTRALVDHIRRQLGRVDFWRTTHLVDSLRKWIIRFLDRGRNELEIVAPEDQPAVAERLVELARRNDAKLKGAP
jgi:hypothetical protein